VEGTRSMKRRILISIIAGACILLVGIGSMALLTMLRRPPAEAIRDETPLHVQAVRLVPEDVPVVIAGYGYVRALNVVDILPEVSGKIVEIYPNLEVGTVVPRGATLFVIDPRTYKARSEEAVALVEQYGNGIKRLNTQLASDRERLITLDRSRDLAEAEYNRVRQLYEKDQVGTQSAVDVAERAFNTAQDLVAQLERSLAVYPIQIDEFQNNLASARARMEVANINMERTRVVAPFDGRVTWVALEKDQYVAPGGRILSLADDSILEISVPLDSRDAQSWLQFNGTRVAEDSAWFTQLDRVPCTVRWIEDKAGHTWEGVLDRVKQFDRTKLTLTVAVRIEGVNALSKDPDRLPLVDGMFCGVEMPGRIIKGAYRLPQWAVSFENTVYAAVDNRLRTVPVEVAWSYGDSAFVTGGLEPGDIVVTTRLVNPLEHSLLDLSFNDEEAQS